MRAPRNRHEGHAAITALEVHSVGRRNLSVSEAGPKNDDREAVVFSVPVDTV